MNKLTVKGSGENTKYLCNGTVITPTYYRFLRRVAFIHSKIKELYTDDFEICCLGRHMAPARRRDVDEFLAELDLVDVTERHCEKGMLHLEGEASRTTCIEESIAAFAWNKLSALAPKMGMPRSVEVTLLKVH